MQQRFHQRTFSGTIFTYYAQIISAVHFKIQIPDNRFSLIP